MAEETRSTSPQAPKAQAFILRLWPERPGVRHVHVIWRVSLQDVTTQARRGFGSLDEFFDFLERLCGEEYDL